MVTFDQVLPLVTEAITGFDALFDCIAINRDLNSRISIVASEGMSCEQKKSLAAVSETLRSSLGAHYAGILMESDEDLRQMKQQDEVVFSLPNVPDVLVFDRLAVENSWIAPTANVPATTPRIVFYSIKGGVGRSTALAALAWKLAQEGKKIIVLDMDLESPGLSSMLLPEEGRPAYGMTDWLVEDLLDNGDSVFDYTVARSDLSGAGDLHVIPAHGKDPGEYIAKLGRAWMPKADAGGNREAWAKRLNRFLTGIEAKYNPDVFLIDSRAGIDSVAAACVTEMKAEAVLLFANDNRQTWIGYDILFRYWNRTGSARRIREKLQLVGAMVPQGERRGQYLTGLLDKSSNLFETLYDEIPEGDIGENAFSFDRQDVSAPHFPLEIQQSGHFAHASMLHGLFGEGVKNSVAMTFRDLFNFTNRIITEG